MQEEIGTGGGGFRYIYAAFLQEAYGYYPDDVLLEISASFTRAGGSLADSGRAGSRNL